MKLALAVLAVLAAAVVGCGGDDASESDSSDQPPATTESEHRGGEDKPAGESAGGWTGLQANTYRVAQQVCGAQPLRKTAQQLGLPASADEFTVAEEYSKGSTAEHQQTSFEGCLAGLGVRPAD